MLVAGAVLWVIIGIVYVIYKLGAEAFGSAAIGILSVLLVVTCFVSLGAVINLTQSGTCGFAAGVTPICILLGWASDDWKKCRTAAAIFAILLCGIAFFEMLRNPNIFTLIAGISMGIFVFYVVQIEKREEEEKGQAEGQAAVAQSNDAIIEQQRQLARELQDRTHIPPACIYTWAENSQFCELLEVAKQSSKLNDAIIYPLMQQVLREQKPKGQVAFNMRSSIIAVHKALQSDAVAEGRDG